VRLVEGADQVGARVGQREAPALAGMVAGKRERRHLAALDRHERHELHRVELARRPEQHSVAVRGAAFRRLRGPRRVTQRQVERLGVARLVLLPGGQRVRERDFIPAADDRRPDERLELRPERRAVERGRRLALVGVRRLALDEQALDRVERRERVLRRLERPDLVLHAEECRHEILDVGTQRDHQVPLGPVAERAGRLPRLAQATGQRRVGAFQVVEEQAVDAGRPLGRVKVGEREPVGES